MDLYSLAISSAPNSYRMSSDPRFTIAITSFSISVSDLWPYNDSESSGDPYDDFPQSEEPVWILGIKYSSLHGLKDEDNYFENKFI